MTQALALKGHAVHLLAPDAISGEEALEADRDWDALARHYGLRLRFPIEWIAIRPSWRKYDFAWHAVGRSQVLEADYLYTRLPQAAALASTRGGRVIFEVHDAPQGNLGPRIFRFLLGSPQVLRIVLISEALKADLSSSFGIGLEPPRTIVAPDGVDLERFKDLPEPPAARHALNLEAGLSLPETAFTAGYSGHLYAGRGTSLILELAARLPQVTFLIVGGEPEAVERLKAQAQARNLTNLYLTGFIPNADLPRYQAACDFLLMPYQRRVAASSGGDIARYLSPMKLFEYLACGRVILSSDLPVLCEALSPENAVLLPPEDVNAWCEAILALCAQPEKRTALARQARQVAQGYTWESRAGLVLSGLEGMA